MTALVRFTGWGEGFRKVSFTKLLHEQANLPLARAKHTTDRLLDGEQVYVERPTVDAATTLARLAEQVGAVGEVWEVRRRRHWSSPRQAASA